MILFEFCAENGILNFDYKTDSRESLLFLNRKFDENTDGRRNM